MVDTTLPALDAGGTVRPRTFRQEDDGAGGLKFTAMGLEHPEQRAALIEAVLAAARAPGTAFADRSVPVISASQAAGTASVLPANASRKVLALTPVADGRLYIASAAGGGFYWPLYAGVTKSLTGAECPTNALFVTGQPAGATLAIAEG
jgi:hypothetical protein